MSFEEFKKAHDNNDSDNSPSAIHHTLGKGPTQAAKGDHNHSGQYAVADHTHVSGSIGEVIMFLGSNPPTSEYLLLNGQSITRANYPALFNVLGVPIGTDLTYLPDYRDRFPVGASAGKPVNTTGGSSSVTLTSDNLPSHVQNVTVTNIDVASGAAVNVVSSITKTTAGTAAPVGIPLPPWAAVNFFVKAT